MKLRQNGAAVAGSDWNGDAACEIPGKARQSLLSGPDQQLHDRRRYVVAEIAPRARVVPREGGEPSTPRLLGSITTITGILDAPPEPVIRPAGGRTGWRSMTTEYTSAFSRHDMPE